MVNWRDVRVYTRLGYTKQLGDVVRHGYCHLGEMQFNADGSLAAWPKYALHRAAYDDYVTSMEAWAELPVDWSGMQEAVIARLEMVP